MEKTLTFTDENGTKKNDQLDLSAFLSDFDSRIKNTAYKVYGLTGDWGTGKSTFIQIWEGQQEHGSFIHIDAFEKDYESNAFLVIFSAIYFSLKKIKHETEQLPELLKEAKKFFSTIAIATGKVAFDVFIDKTIGKENYKTFIDEVQTAYTDDIFNKCLAEEHVHQKLVETLQNLTSKLETPLFIIIDELDRCRPSFALEMLDKIKHIFSVENIKFILVYNKTILKNIIEKEYGLTDKGERYLGKFIESDIELKYKIDIKDWLTFELKNDKHGFINSNHFDNLFYMQGKLLKIKAEYNISLRDFVRIISKIKYYVFTNSSDLSIIVAIELLRDIDRDEFDKISSYVRLNGQLDSHAPEIKSFNQLCLKLYGSRPNISQNEIMEQCRENLVRILQQTPIL